MPNNMGAFGATLGRTAYGAGRGQFQRWYSEMAAQERARTESLEERQRQFDTSTGIGIRERELGRQYQVSQAEAAQIERERQEDIQVEKDKTEHLRKIELEEKRFGLRTSRDEKIRRVNEAAAEAARKRADSLRREARREKESEGIRQRALETLDRDDLIQAGYSKTQANEIRNLARQLSAVVSNAKANDGLTDAEEWQAIEMARAKLNKVLDNPEGKPKTESSAKDLHDKYKVEGKENAFYDPKTGKIYHPKDAEAMAKIDAGIKTNENTTKIEVGKIKAKSDLVKKWFELRTAVTSEGKLIYSEKQINEIMDDYSKRFPEPEPDVEEVDEDFEYEDISRFETEEEEFKRIEGKRKKEEHRWMMEEKVTTQAEERETARQKMLKEVAESPGVEINMRHYGKPGSQRYFRDSDLEEIARGKYGFNNDYADLFRAMVILANRGVPVAIREKICRAYGFTQNTLFKKYGKYK